MEVGASPLYCVDSCNPQHRCPDASSEKCVGDMLMRVEGVMTQIGFVTPISSRLEMEETLMRSTAEQAGPGNIGKGQEQPFGNKRNLQGLMTNCQQLGFFIFG